MASHGKKRRTVQHHAGDAVEEIDADGTEEQYGSDEEMDSDENSSDMEVNEEVQVEFEALPPVDTDFHGIKRLLQQLFLKSKINLSELTELIISQNYVGSVIKQSANDLIANSDSDDEDSDDDIFGFSTIINMIEKKDINCIKQINTMLVGQCSKCCQDSEVDRLQKILSDETRPVGLLLNDRFVNVPPQIALPQHQSLQKDIKDAVRKGMKYSFEYFLLIGKSFKVATDEGEQGQGSKKQGKKKKSGGSSDDLQFSNPEDEFFYKESEVSFSYPVTRDSDSVLAGTWSFSDTAMKTFRTVMVIPKAKFHAVLTRLEEELAM